MYRIKINSLKPKENSKKDYSYLVDIFKRMQADVTEEEILLPDSVLTKMEDLQLPHEIYTFFELVWSNEKKEVKINDIVGSHDFRNIIEENFLENMINTCDQENLKKYVENPKEILEVERNPFLLFEKDGKFYIADGHHRLSTLLTHYQILKNKNLSLENIPTTIPAIVRVVPKNIDFITKFISFCEKNQLYEEDEIGIIPCFTLVESNEGRPKIKYDGLDIIIDENTNLEELLSKIQEEKKKRGLL